VNSRPPARPTLPRQRRQSAAAARPGERRLRSTTGIVGTLRSFDEVIGVLDVVTDPAEAAWATLVGLTAGMGLGFNRAFLLRVEGGEVRGWFGIGPRHRDEAPGIWARLGGEPQDSLLPLLRPGFRIIAAEQALHAPILDRLAHPLVEGCFGPGSAFVARAATDNTCLRHWLEVLDTSALAVIPLRGPRQPSGVILADNFITRRPIGRALLQAGEALAHALRIALERTQLIARLTREHHRLLAAEQSATLLDAARDLVHDLKNPLALAGGLARELAASSPNDQSVLERQLRLIADAVHRTEERVAYLADRIAAKAAEVAVEAVDTGKLAERVVEMFRPMAQAQGVRLVCYHPSRTLLAAASPASLERCLENLIGNALTALAKMSGTVTVMATDIEGWIAIRVADDGPPLPPQIRVDPFGGGITTHRGGSGLGLASVQRLMAAMGGRIEYDEHEPGWVRFTLWLRRWT
jgi:signal transduction histidine kinase